MKTYGPYTGTVEKLHDGDTIDVKLDLGFDITVYARCRVYGINAPELRTEEGKAALAYAETLLKPGDLVRVTSFGWDKYGGRIDAAISLSNGVDFGRMMLNAGQAIQRKY